MAAAAVVAAAVRPRHERVALGPQHLFVITLLLLTWYKLLGIN